MSQIQWTDETWNVVSGCTRVSPGCDHCYIERTPPFRMQGRRFDKPGVGGSTGVVLHPDRLDKPLHWWKPRRVFVNSLSDLFHDDVPDDLIWGVWETMAKTPRHSYQILTKRPARARSLLRGWGWGTDTPPLSNVWIGVSVEDQQRADLRVPVLLEIPAAVRFLSCEPLLGPVDLAVWLPGATCGCGHAEIEHSSGHRTEGCQGGDGSFDDPVCGCRKLRGERLHRLGDPYDNHGLHWVIVGGESGPGARPMDIAWARSLVEQCRNADVAVFVKQLGSVLAREHARAEGLRNDDPKGGEMWRWPEDLRVREMPEVRHA